MNLKPSLAAFALLALANAIATGTPSHSQSQPRFKVDPAWPQPLPPGEILGQVAGIAVDAANDSVWIIQRPRSLVDDEKGATKSPPETRCCKAAPPVIQFDQKGRVLRRWGGAGQGYDWPTTEHGIHVDREAMSGSPATARPTTRS